MHKMILTNKSPENTLIVVAMSGGVDSSVVAALLVEQGYQVIGITLQLYDYGQFQGKKGSCCAGQDIYDASQVAAKLGIPHYIFDYESKFKESVIQDFIENYTNGETPLPCVQCNQNVKFVDLMKASKELKADFLATGHYVQKIIKENGIQQLHKGIDIKKDQSYFLFATTKEQLEYLTFPLGGMSKDLTRKIAQKYSLITSDKPDSQDICFVPNGSYVDVVKKFKPESIKKGLIMHIDGYEIGKHDGIIGFTIGQRKGLGISHPSPLYVIKIDPEKNIVYVGPDEALYKEEFIVKECNWLGNGDFLSASMEVTIKIRSTNIASSATIEALNDNQIKVTMKSAERAITPGQACVFYKGTQVLGGGWIKRN